MEKKMTKGMSAAKASKVEVKLTAEDIVARDAAMAQVEIARAALDKASAILLGIERLKNMNRRLHLKANSLDRLLKKFDPARKSERERERKQKQAMMIKAKIAELKQFVGEQLTDDDKKAIEWKNERDAARLTKKIERIEKKEIAKHAKQVEATGHTSKK